MVGSDVVAVGYMEDVPFAVDYYINSVEACNYDGFDLYGA
jgi:hypothetical protein